MRVQLTSGPLRGCGGVDVRFYSKPNRLRPVASCRNQLHTWLPPFRKQSGLTCPDAPRVFCCPFPTLQCPKCPSCQRSSESQTLPATADLHSYTVSRKHAVIIFIFFKCHSLQQQLHIHFISKRQEVGMMWLSSPSKAILSSLQGEGLRGFRSWQTSRLFLADPPTQEFIHQVRTRNHQLHIHTYKRIYST